VQQEFAGLAVSGLVADGHGGVLAIVGGHSLWRRPVDGAWSEIAKSEVALSCCVAMADVIFAGTEDASILRIDADGTHERLSGFDSVPGRETWYAGAAMVDGKLMGPPLGIRTIAATCDSVVLANVHVGGIPRSTDGGLTWRPTIDVGSDVHEVRAHPTRLELAIAASASGLCISRDGGASWTIEQRGLHAPYCSAVAFGRNDIFVAASDGHFAAQGAVYRRAIESDDPQQPLGGGMPAWIEGIADTNCIATRDSTIAVIDAAGQLYVSDDDGASWSHDFDRLPVPSGLCIC
jgi:hypothetical protein